MSIPQCPRVVVTGGAGGLGRAFCLALAQRRARILIADRDFTAAGETGRLVNESGGTAHVVTCDVAKSAEVDGLLALADEYLGGVDLLINNAGVAVGGPVGEVPLPDWEWIMGINLWGVIYGCHAFVPRFKAQRSGHILNVASAAGLLSAPEMAPYNVTKAGVVALSETLSGELREHGVGVTVLCPTFFQTNILASSRRTQAPDGVESVVAARMAQSKLQADGVARAALKGCDRGALYVVPMTDGKWAWRMKRLAPERYHAMMPKLLAAMRAKAARMG
ncbi:MAG: SDR family NAD(P)-dependent oxidoreductase [Candidatus Binatia bacterium]